MQLSWELRTGRGRRTTSSDVHFGQLEVLECLWPRGAREPEYTEVWAVQEGEREDGMMGRTGLLWAMPMGTGLTVASALYPPRS